ncbi:MAG: hypothetical protein JNM65_04335 [Verrucomicrobiaceae bacterium]|nr:hypothetical protein [Verrucomicrobiaceae bacterium]
MRPIVQQAAQRAADLGDRSTRPTGQTITGTLHKATTAPGLASRAYHAAENLALNTLEGSFAAAAAEKLVVRWMDSGTTVLSVEGLLSAIKAIVAYAQGRSAAGMLMTAAAKLLVTEKAMAGGNTLQIARLIDLYRNTGTEQARALNMRYDPQSTPEERAAMYIQEANPAEGKFPLNDTPRKRE